MHTFPQHSILLIDTFDTIAAAHKAVGIAREMESRGERLAGVRLDSGDLVALSKAVRRIFDTAGLAGVKIFASGGLDEDFITTCLAAGAPIDAFGVGTRMNVSADAPYLDMAYKLVRYDGRDVLKTSPGKATWPGPKQVYRARGPDGGVVGDVIGRRDDAPPNPSAAALLLPVMRDGELLVAHPTLSELRRRCHESIAALPPEVRRLSGAVTYPVTYSAGLRALREGVEAQVTS